MLKRFKFYKEKAGVISENKAYIIYDRKLGYMYESESIFELLKVILTEWKNDKNLIG